MEFLSELNGTIIFRNSGVSIVRKNMSGIAFHNVGEVKMPCSNINEVEVVPGSSLNGFSCIVENEYGSPS